MKFFRTYGSLLGGLASAIAVGLLTNLVTSDAPSGVTIVAFVIAVLLSVVFALASARQQFLSEQAERTVVAQRGTLAAGRDASTATVDLGLAPSRINIGGIQAETPSGWTFEADPEDSESRLFASFKNLEYEATKVLNRKLGERRRSIFDMRADLTRLGIWSEEDVRAFDRAVRVRNAIVHGDVAAVRAEDVLKASRIVQMLMERLEKAT